MTSRERAPDTTAASATREATASLLRSTQVLQDLYALSSKGTDSEATFASGGQESEPARRRSGRLADRCRQPRRFYTCCHLEVDRGAHQGGTADCLAPALCESVSIRMVSWLHHFVNQLNEFRLKSAATCTSPAVYYQSCSTCHAQGTGTFGEWRAARP